MKTKQHKRTLTPKLRFPAFRDASGWENMTLGDITTKTDKRNKEGKSYPVFSISNKTGFTPQSVQFEGVDSEKRGYDLSIYKLIGPKTFAYNPARINVGSIGYSGDLDNVIISSLYVCFKARPGVDDQFLLNVLGTSEFERSVNNHVEGGIRSYLFYENFARIWVPIPLIEEQEKITDCLSSLDGLIAAEGRKLTALRDHKQGLMQQLFPQPGQTRPRLRFPEFRKAGQWEEKPFENLYDFKPNNTYSREQLNYEHGTVKNIHYGDIHTRFSTHFHINAEKVPFVDAKVLPNDLNPESLCRPGDVIFADASEDLADVGKCIEIVNVGDERVLSGSHTILARPRSQSLVVGFGGYLFKSRSTRAGIEKEAQGTKVMQISPKRLATIQVFFPSDAHEQQAIVACLTALDTRITAQATKIAALKTHKRGLMQQLFPSPEDN